MARTYQAHKGQGLAKNTRHASAEIHYRQKIITDYLFRVH